MPEQRLADADFENCQTVLILLLPIFAFFVGI